MCFVFWMSTEGFSSLHTFSLIKTILRFLFPGIAPQEVRLIHAMIRKAAHVGEYFMRPLEDDTASKSFGKLNELFAIFNVSNSSSGTEATYIPSGKDTVL